MGQRVFIALCVALLVLIFSGRHAAQGETTKLVVAYSSPAATFCPGWIAKREGIFAKYNLDVEMVLMQGPSTYMPALASGNIQVMYGGGTADIPSHWHGRFRLGRGGDGDALYTLEVNGPSFDPKSNGFERQEAGSRPSGSR